MILINYTEFFSKRFDLVIRYHLLVEAGFDVSRARQLLFSEKYKFLRPIFKTLLEQDMDKDPFIKTKVEKNISKIGVVLEQIGAEQFFHIPGWVGLQKAMKEGTMKLLQQPYSVDTKGVGNATKRFLIALQYKKKLYWCKLSGGKSSREMWKEENYKLLLSVEWYKVFKKSQNEMMRRMYKLKFFSTTHLVDRSEKVVAYIPARGGSKGIKRKNLYPLRKKPLIYYVIKTALKTVVDEVWVATDDQKIQEVALRAGALVYYLPKNLTTDTSSLDRTMVHFARQVQCKTIVLLQATSPLTLSGDIDKGISCFAVGEYDSVLSVINTNDILIWDKKGNAPLNYAPFDRGRRQDRLSGYVIETGNFYITARKKLLQTECRIGGSVGFTEIPFWTHFQIDTLEDVKNIERLLS